MHESWDEEAFTPRCWCCSNIATQMGSNGSHVCNEQDCLLLDSQMFSEQHTMPPWFPVLRTRKVKRRQWQETGF